MSDLREALEGAVRPHLPALADDPAGPAAVRRLLDAIERAVRDHVPTGILPLDGEPLSEEKAAEIKAVWERGRHAPPRVLPPEPRPADAEVRAWIDAHPAEFAAWLNLHPAPPARGARPAPRRRTPRKD